MLKEGLVSIDIARKCGPHNWDKDPFFYLPHWDSNPRLVEIITSAFDLCISLAVKIVLWLSVDNCALFCIMIVSEKKLSSKTHGKNLVRIKQNWTKQKHNLDLKQLYSYIWIHYWSAVKAICQIGFFFVGLYLTCNEICCAIFKRPRAPQQQ